MIDKVKSMQGRGLSSSRFWYRPTKLDRAKSLIPKFTTGFTLIELLVVISIIGLLSTVVLASLSNVRAKARDAKRKVELAQLMKANELHYNTNGSYAPTAGWLSNWNGINNALTSWISPLPVDPLSSNIQYQYWRKDYTSYSCMNLNNIEKAAFYAYLEQPSASDLATISDSFDQCVRTNWGLNYKVGN